MDLHHFEKDALPARMVAIKPIGGLGSRMKCIASFAVIAQHFGVPLYVYWNVSAGFEKIECNELFEKIPDNVRLLAPNSWNLLRGSTGRVIKLDERISYLTRNYMFSDYRLEELFHTRKPFRLTAECNRDLQKLYGSILHQFIPQFNAKYLQKLVTFEPIAVVKKLVACEVRSWGDTDTNVLGVHLRRNDALQSRVSNKYLSVSDNEAMAIVDTHLDENSAVSNTVFLAIDDPYTFDTFAEKYKEEPRVRWYNWKRFNYKLHTQKGGQLKALADLTTLRCCTKVVGPSFSVFNEVARLSIARSVVLHSYCLQTSDSNNTDTHHQLIMMIDTEEPPEPEPEPEPEPAPEPEPEPAPAQKSNKNEKEKQDKPPQEPDIVPKPESNIECNESNPDLPAPKISNALQEQTAPVEPADANQVHGESDADNKQNTHTKAISNATNTNEEGTTQSAVDSNKSIAVKTLLYLYKANPDPIALQNQVRLLLHIDSNTDSTNDDDDKTHHSDTINEQETKQETKKTRNNEN